MAKKERFWDADVNREIWKIIKIGDKRGMIPDTPLSDEHIKVLQEFLDAKKISIIVKKGEINGFDT